MDPRIIAVTDLIDALAQRLDEAALTDVLERLGLEPGEEDDELFHGLVLDAALWPMSGHSPLAQHLAAVVAARPELAGAAAAYAASTCDVFRVRRDDGGLLARSSTGGAPARLDHPLDDDLDEPAAVLLRIVRHEGVVVAQVVAPLLDDFRELPDDLQRGLRTGAKTFPKAWAELRRALVMTYRLLEEADADADEAELETLARAYEPTEDDAPPR
jgi:hypothetical protein